MRVLVIGSGLAGVNAALLASDFAHVTLLSKSDLAETNTNRAQGGIAAAIDALDDPRLHAQDTIRAGAGLCDPTAVQTLTDAGPDAIQRLQELGVQFDRTATGQPALASEGAHSQPRVLHAGGDQTGLHIQSALLQRLQDANVDVQSGVTITDLAVDAGRCVGAITDDGRTILADATILATGGAGALFRTTTNPANASGDGPALAFRAGAVLRDMEFVQFHPTALVGDDGAFLISEALRGDGAVLLDTNGYRFMPEIHADAELAPRSVVAKAITEAMQRTGEDHVLLDISHRDASYIREPLPRRLPRRASTRPRHHRRTHPRRARRALPHGRRLHRNRRPNHRARPLRRRRVRIHRRARRQPCRFQLSARGRQSSRRAPSMRCNADASTPARCAGRRTCDVNPRASKRGSAPSWDASCARLMNDCAGIAQHGGRLVGLRLDRIRRNGPTLRERRSIAARLADAVGAD